MSRSRRPTIVDVAERAGVSKSLVSLVMQGSPKVSDTSRDAVLKAARDLGYMRNAMARSLARQRTGVLGCIISDLHNPFFADVADGVEEEASTNGYHALISPGFLDGDREAKAIDTLIQLRADGLLMLGPMISLTKLAAVAGNVPVVVLGRHVHLSGMDSVHNDDVMGAKLAVDHLSDLGHQTIAHIDGGSGAGARRRTEGYAKAMRERGLEENIREVRGAFTEEGGVRGMRALLDGGDLPSAVFVANDYAALGALDELDRTGLKVPGDMSVVGYDDGLLAHLPGIALTTVRQPTVEMGRVAVQMLVEKIEEGRLRARHVVLPPTLVVRGTTGPPPS